MALSVLPGAHPCRAWIVREIGTCRATPCCWLLSVRWMQPACVPMAAVLRASAGRPNALTGDWPRHAGIGGRGRHVTRLFAIW